MLQTCYTGYCSSCETQSTGYGELLWIKTEGQTATLYCPGCKKLFEVTFSFKFLPENETEERMKELNKGVVLIQHRPNYFSGY